ncbi:MAG: YkgJ family cysteine cluster protein [Candidatus Hodarchaeota archaeon]
MKSAIKGPDCTDPNKCRGNCCSIKIDVPKVLAEEYINRNYASKEDFIRSDVFSFELRFNEETGKCFLFDLELNGCKVHNSGIKPPQCWIYPFSNFPNPYRVLISCKKLSGWQIINLEKTLEAEKLLEKYNFLCKLEAKAEIKNIKNRLDCNSKREEYKKEELLVQLLMEVTPSKLGGFIDKWDNFDILLAEGFSLQMKKFCLKYNSSCHLLPNDFFECKGICKEIANRLVLFLRQNLLDFIELHGPDTSGEYPLYKLFKQSGIFTKC